MATLIGSHLTREPTSSPVLIKCWNWELILSTNFGSLCPKVTNFGTGSQSFGYQIWFCTRLLNRLFRHRSKKTSKLHVTGLCEGNSPVTGEVPAQRASNAENVSIWWRNHGNVCKNTFCNIILISCHQNTSKDWKVGCMHFPFVVKSVITWYYWVRFTVFSLACV